MHTRLYATVTPPQHATYRKTLHSFNCLDCKNNLHPPHCLHSCIRKAFKKCNSICFESFVKIKEIDSLFVRNSCGNLKKKPNNFSRKILHSYECILYKDKQPFPDWIFIKQYQINVRKGTHVKSSFSFHYLVQ